MKISIRFIDIYCRLDIPLRKMKLSIRFINIYCRLYIPLRKMKYKFSITFIDMYFYLVSIFPLDL